ncbi:ankyrin repeat domain-containing protein [Photobacterium satsumensis]|uniref:ankyrin repeat domain-containing protein n=1 Tax=Photobacterium satsumensis TaxID=2910239 RepID=UPI003D10372D
MKKLYHLGIGVIFTMAILLISTSSCASEHDADYQALLEYYFAAARTADTEVLSEFINAGLPVDTQDSKGYSALMFTSYHGHYQATKLLLNKGANACLKDNRGNTALMAAIFKGEVKIAKQLMNTQCNTDSQNNAGQTALMYASLFGREELKAILIERGADITLEDSSGNSAMSLEKQ